MHLTLQFPEKPHMVPPLFPPSLTTAPLPKHQGDPDTPTKPLIPQMRPTELKGCRGVLGNGAEQEGTGTLLRKGILSPGQVLHCTASLNPTLAPHTPLSLNRRNLCDCPRLDARRGRRLGEESSPGRSTHSPHTAGETEAEKLRDLTSRSK